MTWHDIALHYTVLQHMTWHYIAVHCVTLHYITLHYIALPYLTLPYITVQYITLPYLTLHYKQTYTQTYMYTSNHIHIYVHVYDFIMNKKVAMFDHKGTPPFFLSSASQHFGSQRHSASFASGIRPSDAAAAARSSLHREGRPGAPWTRDILRCAVFLGVGARGAESNKMAKFQMGCKTCWY